MNLLSSNRTTMGVAITATSVMTAAERAIVGGLRLELVPSKHLHHAIVDLLPGSRVSVTCLPAKGLSATQDAAARLVDLGHDVVPHIAARLVTGTDHVAALARWISATGVREVFIVGGDSAEPAGPYADGSSFLGDLLAHDTGLERVGVPGYPDGHPGIDDNALRNALRVKQTLIADAGLAGSVTTQMCFDATRVADWLTEERARGMNLPVVLGVPGVVDRARLLSMGARLGVGASLRYLRKNRSSVRAMLGPRRYDPTELVSNLTAATLRLGLNGLHAFTFNSVGDTVAWQHSLLDPARR